MGISLNGFVAADEQKEMKKWAIDTFSLADVDCDGTIYEDELASFWKATESVPGLSDDQMSWIRDKKEKVKKADKYKFLELLLEAQNDLNLTAESISDNFYRRQVGILGCCPCRYMRSYLMASRFDRMSPEEAHYGWVSIISNFGIQMVHLLDLFTDSYLAL